MTLAVFEGAQALIVLGTVDDPSLEQHLELAGSSGVVILIDIDKIHSGLVGLRVAIVLFVVISFLAAVVFVTLTIVIGLGWGIGSLGVLLWSALLCGSIQHICGDPQRHEDEQQDDRHTRGHIKKQQ